MLINDNSTYTEELKRQEINTPIANTSKFDSQLELPLILKETTPIRERDNNIIASYEGQKWQNFLDFEVVLQQIRLAEKTYLKGKCDNLNSGKDSSNNGNSINGRCSRHLSQVQRLNGNDMDYYGVAPKRNALEAVVCELCKGVYTKVGFKNHVKLRHPNEWTSVPAKFTEEALAQVESGDNRTQESIPGAIETIKSPIDPSVLISTPSTSSSSSTLAASLATNPRHKTGKSGNSSGTSSSSARPKSKTKHRHSSHITHSSSTSATRTQQPVVKVSKKNSGRSVTAGANVVTVKESLVKSASNSSTNDLIQPVRILSSSSNSSYTLPVAQKMIVTNVMEVSGSNYDSYSPANSLIVSSDGKDILIPDTAYSKKKGISPTVIGQESIDSASNCSSNSSSSKFSITPAYTPSNKSHKNKRSTSSNSKLSSRKQVEQLSELRASQLSELDQAVSSIIAGQDNKIQLANETFVNAGNIQANSSNNVNTLKMRLSNHRNADCRSTQINNQMMNTNYGRLTQQEIQTCGDSFQQNVTEDNGMLTLEDMLDSKFINEILNTTESNKNFEANNLNVTAQQSYCVQPKRVRYDYETNMLQQQQPSTEMTCNDFGVYQQPQLVSQQPHYQHFDGNNVRIFNPADQQVMQLNGQYQVDQQQSQQQIAALGTMQFQQILYQQNNINVSYNDALTAENVINPTQQFNICSENEEHKVKSTDISGVEHKLSDYNNLASMNNVYEGNTCVANVEQFNVYSIPSICDDIIDANNIDIPNVIDNERPNQQYMLPSTNEEQLIYEITANNQVSVMSQQRQQQVIAEFLRQSVYENMENLNMVPQNDNTVMRNGGFMDDDDELLDLDFTQLETVKSISNNNSMGESKIVKNESSTKYQDDLYCNVFLYSGIPRPLSLNCFGITKLPLSAGTTFRKNLITTRKANHSPKSGNLNSTARFSCNINSKSISNYFHTLSNTSGNNLANEYSIGNVSISNSSSNIPMNSTFALQRQQSGSNCPMEITFNIGHSENGLTTVPVSTSIPRGSRAKSNTTSITLTNMSSVSNSAVSKSKIASGVTTSVPTNVRLASRQNSVTQQNIKTVYVNNSPNANNRTKFIKRSLIAKVDSPKKNPKNAHFSSKQIFDMLNSNKSVCKQQNSSIQSDQCDVSISPETNPKFDRVEQFYKHRKKLCHMTNNPNSQQSQMQEQVLKMKLTKHPQIMKTLSDCNPNAIVHCKTSNTTATNNAGDAMRVFV